MNRCKTFLIIVCMILITGCSVHNSKIYDVKCSGKTFTINEENKTILCEGIIYSYDIKESTINITFPNGSYYWLKDEKNVTYDGQVGPVEEEYISGDILVELVSSKLHTNPNIEESPVMFMIFCIGAINVIFPYICWYLTFGIRYSNVLPTKIILILIRISGVIIIVLEAVYLLSN